MASKQVVKKPAVAYKPPDIVGLSGVPKSVQMFKPKSSYVAKKAGFLGHIAKFFGVSLNRGLKLSDTLSSLKGMLPKVT